MKKSCYTVTQANQSYISHTSWDRVKHFFFAFTTSFFLVLLFLSSPSSSFLCRSPHPCTSSSSSQGDILTVTRKIDANWYEGYHGDQKGIFPITYVEVVEEGEIITCLSQ